VSWQQLGSWPCLDVPVDGVYVEFGAGADDTPVIQGRHNSTTSTAARRRPRLVSDELVRGRLRRRPPLAEWMGRRIRVHHQRAGAELVFHFDGTGYGDCDVWTTRLYDLTADTVSVEVTAPARPRASGWS